MKLPSADSLKKERQIREGIESSLAEIILKAAESEQTSVSIDLEDFEGDQNYLGTNYSKVVEILENKGYGFTLHPTKDIDGGFSKSIPMHLVIDWS
ncbi:MAG: hypothetical protein KH084_14195 [Enterococcus gallinarum]|nr:hypothetical protein [Enterococcus gallinarum]